MRTGIMDPTEIPPPPQTVLFLVLTGGGIVSGSCQLGLMLLQRQRQLFALGFGQLLGSQSRGETLENLVQLLLLGLEFVRPDALFYVSWEGFAKG